MDFQAKEAMVHLEKNLKAILEEEIRINTKIKEALLDLEEEEEMLNLVVEGEGGLIQEGQVVEIREVHLNLDREEITLGEEVDPQDLEGIVEVVMEDQDLVETNKAVLGEEALNLGKRVSRQLTGKRSEWPMAGRVSQIFSQNNSQLHAKYFWEVQNNFWEVQIIFLGAVFLLKFRTKQ